MRTSTKVVNSCLAAGVLVFAPKLALFYLLCGGYDIYRNTQLDKDMLRKYFAGSGVSSFLLSPFNVLMDVLSLPFGNKKIYQLEDLPKVHQQELKFLLQGCETEAFYQEMETQMKGVNRGMFFYQWYGQKVRPVEDRIPAFTQNYKTIKTIGVSVFNSKVSTNRHFGPLRASLRVLYNVNEMRGHDSYIDVGEVRNYWSENKLFIFDDTLLHRSVNGSEDIRYCLFVDIVRPGALDVLTSAVVQCIGFCCSRINFKFYKNWVALR